MKHRFDLGDTVYLMKDNKICTAFVNGVSFDIFDTYRVINYNLRDCDSIKSIFIGSYRDTLLFETKEELLKSL